MSWHQELLVGFDLETTGTDPSQARIVSAALVEVKAGEAAVRREWLVDPGVPIPEEAARIHGITDERVRAHGLPPAAVLEELAGLLAGHWAAGTPVVAFNAVFDLSLLDAELARHGLPVLAERTGAMTGSSAAAPGSSSASSGAVPAQRRAGGAPGPVLDPMTIDRRVEKYRRGSRTLTACCAEYGVELEHHAHEAESDALAAVLLLLKIAERHPELAARSAAQLHEEQIGWHAAWAADFQSWLRRRGNREAVVDGIWPLRPAARGAADAGAA